MNIISSVTRFDNMVIFNNLAKSGTYFGKLLCFWANARCFLKKWANPGLFLFIFILFSVQFQYKLKKA